MTSCYEHAMRGCHVVFDILCKNLEMKVLALYNQYVKLQLFKWKHSLETKNMQVLCFIQCLINRNAI
jgi:hypothetical protein